MARVLLDTNVLARRLEKSSPLRDVSRAAIATLLARGDEPVLAPQTLYELWVVLTRPVTARGGFGFSVLEAMRVQRALLNLYPLLPDNAAIFPAWQSLVALHQIQGVNAHDTRLVAAMQTHGVSQILTYNGKDFARFAPQGITILDPQNL